MKNIIVPTDFSPVSVNAAFYAVEIAKQVQADLILLHVLPLPIAAPEAPMAARSYDLSMEEAKRSLSELKAKLEAAGGNKISVTYHITIESFSSELDRFSREQNIFAMIMGTSGAGATEAMFLGSFSLTASKHFSHPLIVVPPGCVFKGIHKIGLGCDMENVSDTVPFPGIKDLCAQFDARLEVLYVSKSDEKMYPHVLTETKFMQQHLAGLHPEIRITTHSDIKEGLEDFVRTNNIDLLILIPKERNFVENIFHKSVTKKMVLHPEVPVVILH